MNVTSDLTFDLWKYVFQVLQYWQKCPWSIQFQKCLYHFCTSNSLVSAAVYRNVTDGQKNDVFRRSDPNIMGTIETGLSICLRKGLYHFCTSNGLVSAAVYTNMTDGRMDKKLTFSGSFCRFSAFFGGLTPT